MAASVAGMMENFSAAADRPVFPDAYYETRWYAAYTSANHEKRVAEQLAQRSVEHFLPLYSSTRRRKDRQVNLQLPLFPGYVFLQIPLRERLRVLQIPSVVRLVGFGGIPTALPEEEIASLRRAQAERVPLQPHPFLRVGRHVRITAGPLAGREGILKRWKGFLRVLLSIELIQRSVLVDVDVSAIEPVSAHKFHDRIGLSQP
ncbi:MAG TPA: UpxY family transcription antiterminator [Candidatus Acidoferrales bacterium]|nr:UpxY family transcription antiterminator [Candidatus Acidoferrales bacterium]